MTLPRFANLRDGMTPTAKRPGMIRAIAVLAILLVLFWNLPAVMRWIGGMM